MNYYRLEVGYSGADITDIRSVLEKVSADDTVFLVDLLQKGFSHNDVASGFVNVVGRDTYVSFTRMKNISDKSELPTPFFEDAG